MLDGDYDWNARGLARAAAREAMATDESPASTCPLVCIEDYVFGRRTIFLTLIDDTGKVQGVVGGVSSWRDVLAIVNKYSTPHSTTSIGIATHVTPHRPVMTPGAGFRFEQLNALVLHTVSQIYVTIGNAEKFVKDE